MQTLWSRFFAKLIRGELNELKENYKAWLSLEFMEMIDPMF